MIGLRNPGKTWNTTPEEHAATYPCDAYLTEPFERMTRAIDVAAPPNTVFRWLCQIKVAPYSYDWIDNWGRRSPQELTPGLDDLAVGQRFLIFELVEFEPDRHMTLVMLPRATRAFGRTSITYAVTARDDGTTRLVGRVDVETHTPFDRVRAEALALGDLVMMRKQLLTLRDLAERSAAQAS